MKRLTLLATLTVLTGACQHLPKPTTPAYSLQELNELSGLAPLTDGRFIAINDSGNAPALFVLDRWHAPTALIQTDLQNRDWEDLAYIDRDGERLVVVGDVGDNLHHNEQSYLHFFKQSTLDRNTNPTPIETLSFRFDTGPVNCEAFFYAADEQRFYFFSKSRDEATIFTLKWPVAETGAVARRLATLSLGPPVTANKLFAALTGINPETPTAASVSVDGQRLALLTYRSVWFWQKSPQTNWAEALKTPPHRLLKHQLPQAEALSFSNDSRHLLIGSEGAAATFRKVALPY